MIMIEKIAERLESSYHVNFNFHTRDDYRKIIDGIYDEVFKIVQEVAKEFATDTNVGDKWIACSERLPEEHKLVLIYAESTARGGSIRRVAQLHNGFWFVQTASDTLGLIGQYKVIKWTELPEV